MLSNKAVLFALRIQAEHVSVLLDHEYIWVEEVTNDTFLIGLFNAVTNERIAKFGGDLFCKRDLQLAIRFICLVYNQQKRLTQLAEAV